MENSVDLWGEEQSMCSMKPVFPKYNESAAISH